MSKYLIVLFKNKVRKKIIKKYQNGKSAMNFFNNLISENEKVIFPREVENTVDSNYEVAVLEKNSQRLLPTYMTDEFGRSIKVKLENPDYNIIKISPYRYPETIFDIERNKKITVDFFLNRYLPKVGVKVMSVLNNKVIIQNDDEVRLFSLKSENEAERFIAEISSLFYKNKRGDCLFVTDTSSPQRKYLFQFLESKGFDKKILYRKFTTHPRHLRPK
jgi:hypothetical protein